jgi:hypothetical protein
MTIKCAIVSVIIIVMMVTSACTKNADGIQGPPGPAGEAGKSVNDQRSAITGYLLPVNEFTITDTVLDSINVSTMMGDSVLSVFTDNTGKFVLPNLKSGNYRLMFKKNGYDSIGRDISHSAGNEDQFIDIIQIDGTQTTKILAQNIQVLLSPFDNITKYIVMNTTLSGPPITSSTMRYMDVYFSSSPNLNTHNYLYTTNTYTHNEGTNQFGSQIFFAGTNINSGQFNVGDTVYMKSYIVPPYSFDTSWFDSNSYQTVSYPYIVDSLSNYFIWTN